MLVLNRFTVPAEREAEFRAQAETALEVLAARSGYVSGELTARGRARPLVPGDPVGIGGGYRQP